MTVTLTAVLSSRTNFENLKLTPNFFLILSISSDVRPSGGIPVICWGGRREGREGGREGGEEVRSRLSWLKEYNLPSLELKGLCS